MYLSHNDHCVKNLGRKIGLSAVHDVIVPSFFFLIVVIKFLSKFFIFDSVITFRGDSLLKF